MTDAKKSELRENNRRLVYEALRKLEKQDQSSEIPFLKIETELKGKMVRRTIYRCLDDLIHQKIILRVSDGYYQSQVEKDRMKESKEKLRKVYKITSSDIRGFLTSNRSDDGVDYHNILGQSKAVKKVKKDINDMRMSLHKEKKLAIEESDLYIKSFMNGVNIEVTLSDDDISFKPHGFISRIKPNPILGSLKIKTGLEYIIYEYAFLLYNLLYRNGNIDFSNVNFSKENKVQINLEFNFNAFIYSFLSWIRRLRVYRELDVYSEIPESDLRTIFVDYDDGVLRREFESILRSFSN